MKIHHRKLVAGYKYNIGKKLFQTYFVVIFLCGLERDGFCTKVLMPYLMEVPG